MSLEETYTTRISSKYNTITHLIYNEKISLAQVLWKVLKYLQKKQLWSSPFSENLQALKGFKFATSLDKALSEGFNFSE